MGRALSALLLMAVPVVHAQDEPICSDDDRAAYAQALSQAVTAVWKVPARNRSLVCTLQIRQDFRGEVLNAEVENCGDDRVVHKSAIDAGYRASPLPLPANRACFVRDLTITIESRTQEAN